jgi:hypothetical protein
MASDVETLYYYEATSGCGLKLLVDAALSY